MINQHSMSRLSGGRVGLFDLAFRIFFTPRSDRPLNPLFSASSHQLPNSLAFPGNLEKLKGTSLLDDNGATSLDLIPQFFKNFGMRLGLMNVKDNASLPGFARFRRSIHSSSRKEVETGREFRSMNFVRGIIEDEKHSSSRKEVETGRESRSMNFVRGIIEDDGSHLSGYHVEQNADIVHIKLIRNNTFVTLTDSEGNKKAGASSGSLTEMKGGPKASRYAAEATAEHVGRLTRNMGLKSVVMKVNGFTYFKKKKQAILSFREGYTFSRGDQNPVVYIEDTTRRPHNGCRLRKKRRV